MRGCEIVTEEIHSGIHGIEDVSVADERVNAAISEPDSRINGGWIEDGDGIRGAEGACRRVITHDSKVEKVR